MTSIAYVGNYVVPYTTESYVATALKENGCKVLRVTQDEAARNGPAEFAEMIRGQRIDLVVYTRTHNRTALTAAWTDCWRDLEAHGVVTASLHLDRFWGLERESLITGEPRDPLFTTGHVFTADGGSQALFDAHGIAHHYLPPAVDRAQAEYDGQPNPQLAHDVLFVGSGSPYHEREYPQRGELIAHLRGVYGDRFAHYGHNGGRPVVRERALSDLYRSAKVVVGDSCFANSPPHMRVSSYLSDRYPETVGRGGFLIAPWAPGLSDLFTTGRDLVTHVPGDWEDLDAQIGAYLVAPGERDAIAAEGRRRVLREHTWTARMRDVLCTVGLGDCKEAAA